MFFAWKWPPVTTASFCLHRNAKSLLCRHLYLTKRRRQHVRTHVVWEAMRGATAVSVSPCLLLLSACAVERSNRWLESNRVGVSPCTATSPTSVSNEKSLNRLLCSFMISRAVDLRNRFRTGCCPFENQCEPYKVALFRLFKLMFCSLC